MSMTWFIAMFNVFNDFSLAISVGIVAMWLLSSISVLRAIRPIVIVVVVLVVVLVVVVVVVVVVLVLVVVVVVVVGVLVLVLVVTVDYRECV